MSEQHPLGGRAPGNREVSRHFLFGTRGDLSGARAEAIPKEGSTRGKHGFPRGSEAQRSDERGVFA
jgi:hypothetical protein